MEFTLSCQHEWLTTLYHHHGLGGSRAFHIKETPLVEEGNGSFHANYKQRKRAWLKTN